MAGGGHFSSSDSPELVIPRRTTEKKIPVKRKGKHPPGTIEVPSFRIKYYNPSKTRAKSGELIDDQARMKRHAELEREEKRIKRRHLQTLREQERIEKLKVCQERKKSAAFNSDEPPNTLYPLPENIRAIEITDNIPIMAFGECIPELPARPFELPDEWNLTPANSQCVHNPTKRKTIKKNKVNQLRRHSQRLSKSSRY